MVSKRIQFNIIFAGFLFLTLSACKMNFYGTLDVQEELVLMHKKKPIRVLPGKQGATLKIGSKSSAILEVISSSGLVKPEFKISKKKIPYNGSFYLSSAEIKQSYDLKGDIQTNFEDSGRIYGSEYCSARVFAGYRCTYDKKGRKQCYPEYVYRSGYQNVEYINRMTYRKLEFELLKNNRAVASFDGHNSESEKIYTYRGPCFVY